MLFNKKLSMGALFEDRYIFCVSLFLLIALQSLSGQHDLMNLIPTNTATHTAVQSGDWFSTNTWDTGTIPGDAAIVVIPQGITVNYEGQSTAHIFAIRVDGTFTGKQSNSNDTTKLIFDTFIGTQMSKVEFHANTATDGYIDVQIKPFDIEAHKAGTSGFVQVWNSNAHNHFSDGAAVQQVTYDIGPFTLYKTIEEAQGKTTVTELTRTNIDDGVGILGRYEWDSTQLSIGLVTMGEIEIIGQEKSVMAKLSADANKNQTTIQLETVPTGWKVGDEILITRGGNQGEASPGNETAIIQSIAGNTITTQAGLTRNHGGRPADDLHCYVGDLNRNITFYSANPNEILHRGHFMVMHNPNNIQIKNAAFVDMGRTDKNRLLDDLVWSHWTEPTVLQSYISFLGQECTQLVKVPKDEITNHRGRYSIHLHQTGATYGTNLAQVTGNVVRGNPGWGITHHDAHANISENVVYDVVGSGIVSEVGNETGFWDNNLVVDIKKGHKFEYDEASVFYGDYLFGGQGLGMKGRGVICRGNVIVNAVHGVGVINFNPTNNIGKRMDSEAFAASRPNSIDQFPLDKNGYSKEGDGIIPTEMPLIMENTTMIWCNHGFNSIERDVSVNHESRSIFDGFKVWGANKGITILYQVDYSFRDVFVSGKNANSSGILMYKHSSNMVFERIKLVDLGYGVEASALHNGFQGPRSRNNDYTPWLFIDAETENVTNWYKLGRIDSYPAVPYDNHPDNTIHLSSSQLFDTRPITFTLNDASDLAVNLATGDLQFKVDGAITDRGGTYEYGVTQPASSPKWFSREAYDERIYEFASQAKLEEFLTVNGVYKDTANNDQLYFIINEYVPDRTTYEYKAFPIRVKILNAPATGVFANPQIEDAANFAPQSQLISRFGTASQSSTATYAFMDSTSISAYASKAIDANNNGRPNVDYFQLGLEQVGSSAITQTELEPWWELDLGVTKMIEHIDIWNTVEMQGQAIETPSTHFKDFYVLISEEPFGDVGLSTARANANYEYFNPSVKRLLSLNDLNLRGRYIRIQAVGTTKIGIAEVDVIGKDIIPCSQLVVDDGNPCTVDTCVDGVVSNTLIDTNGNGECDLNEPCLSFSGINDASIHLENMTPASKAFVAKEQITTNQNVEIESSKNVQFLAGESIVLSAGFTIKPGASFIAKIIEDCDMNEAILDESEENRSRSNDVENQVNLFESSKMQVAPNPFSHSANIAIEIPEATKGTLEIYNLNGQLVKTIVHQGDFSKGTNHIHYQPQDKISGMYYLLFTTNKEVISKPIVIIN